LGYIKGTINESALGDLAFESETVSFSTDTKKEKNMKIWILLIFRIAPSIEKYLESLDKRIRRIALNAFGVTVNQYDEILALSMKKAKLVNLRIMYNRLEDELTGEEYFMLQQYAQGETGDQISKQLDIKISLTYKKINKALKKAELALKRAGFDEQRMEKDYLSFAFVSGAISALKVRMRVKN
jgi:DNA-binding CsgD family transcriptional regulator